MIKPTRSTIKVAKVRTKISDIGPGRRLTEGQFSKIVQYPDSPDSGGHDPGSTRMEGAGREGPK